MNKECRGAERAAARREVPWKKEEDYPNSEHAFVVNCGDLRAFVRWDGCVELSRAFASRPDGTLAVDHIHICDLPDMINKLKALLELARGELPRWEGG